MSKKGNSTREHYYSNPHFKTTLKTMEGTREGNPRKKKNTSVESTETSIQETRIWSIGKKPTVGEEN